MYFFYRLLVPLLCILLTITSVNTAKKLDLIDGHSHHTLVTFYHEHTIPLESYWISLESSY